MVSPVIVVVDEGCDLRFQVAGQIIILQQDAVLEGLVPAFDLTLGLGMIWRPTNVAHALLVKPFASSAEGTKTIGTVEGVV